MNAKLEDSCISLDAQAAQLTQTARTSDAEMKPLPSLSNTLKASRSSSSWSVSCMHATCQHGLVSDSLGGSWLCDLAAPCDTSKIMPLVHVCSTNKLPHDDQLQLHQTAAAGDAAPAATPAS